MHWRKLSRGKTTKTYIFLERRFHSWKIHICKIMGGNIISKRILFDLAQNALQWEWGNFPFANWNGICWGLPLQLVQLVKIHFLPHLESFVWERKFEKKFFLKDYIQTPNGVLLIFKLQFPNGSYRNGVCRALWALSKKEITRSY